MTKEKEAEVKNKRNVRKRGGSKSTKSIRRASSNSQATSSQACQPASRATPTATRLADQQSTKHARQKGNKALNLSLSLSPFQAATQAVFPCCEYAFPLSW